MGPLGAPAGGDDTVMTDADTTTPGLPVRTPPEELPSDFTSRVRSHPANTLLHVLASSRLRMIGVVARCWHGIAQGEQ